jgi:hypothetical protein
MECAEIQRAPDCNAMRPRSPHASLSLRLVSRGDGGSQPAGASAHDLRHDGAAAGLARSGSDYGPGWDQRRDRRGRPPGVIAGRISLGELRVHPRQSRHRINGPVPAGSPSDLYGLPAHPRRLPHGHPDAMECRAPRGVRYRAARPCGLRRADARKTSNIEPARREFRWRVVRARFNPVDPIIVASLDTRASRVGEVDHFAQLDQD